MIGFDKLNDMQKKAVLQTEGPVLILAGAGSGKTGALTVRIAHLLETGVKPWHILAITFTNKAAKEMRERVEKLVGDTARAMWISTFHSTCVRILRREIQHLDYENQFSIYDSDDQEKIMRDQLKNLRKQMQVLKYKKDYYKKILASGEGDRCNPKNFVVRLSEPEIAPQEKKRV